MTSGRWIVGAALVALAALGSGCGREKIFDASFARDGLREWSAVQRVAPDRIRLVAGSDGRAGVRFEVRHGDHVAGERDSRAELAWSGRRFSDGEVSTFEWSSEFAPGFPTPPRPRWAVIVQWKNDGEGSPPLQVGVDGGRLDLEAGSQARYRTLWSVPLVQGRWLTFRARIHWSARREDGRVELWYQGRKVLDSRPLATLYAGAESYLKMGLYRARVIRPTGVVYARGMRVFDG